jgi:hypothetical protein
MRITLGMAVLHVEFGLEKWCEECNPHAEPTRNDNLTPRQRVVLYKTCS